MDNKLLDSYVEFVKSVYGSHVKKIILFGSYARGDFNQDSDIDIMILLDISDIEAKDYQEKLFDATYDFNMDNDVDINPMAHSEKLFYSWIDAYPFFNNINREGRVLYNAA